MPLDPPPKKSKAAGKTSSTTLATNKASTQPQKIGSSKPSKSSQATTKNRSSANQDPSNDTSRKQAVPKNLPQLSIISESTATALNNGTHVHEELAGRGYGQQEEADLTRRKLKAYQAQKGDNSGNDDDEEEEDADEDEDEESEGSEDDEPDKDEESESSQRPRRNLAKSNPRRQTALLNQLIGPDDDSDDAMEDLAVDSEACTFTCLFYCFHSHSSLADREEASFVDPNGSTRLVSRPNLGQYNTTLDLQLTSHSRVTSCASQV